MNIQKIISKVVQGHRHEYYKSTVHQSNFGTEVTTGESQEKYIIRLKSEWNETDDKLSQRHKKEIAQAKRIYNSATPAAYRKLAGYFERVFRVDKAANKIEAEKSPLSERFSFELDNFGGTTLLNYLETNYLFLNGVDPNAWLLLTQEIVGDKERIKPIIIRSKDVLDYSINLGILEYLAIQSGYDTKDKEVSEWFFYVKGARYRVLEDDDCSFRKEDNKFYQKHHKSFMDDDILKVMNLFTSFSKVNCNLALTLLPTVNVRNDIDFVLFCNGDKAVHSTFVTIREERLIDVRWGSLKQKLTIEMPINMCNYLFSSTKYFNDLTIDCISVQVWHGKVIKKTFKVMSTHDNGNIVTIELERHRELEMIDM